MGLELSLDRLKKMKKDVFGLGTSQFFLTAACISGVAKMRYSKQVSNIVVDDDL
jgi:Kef-type K+ transport system membrane component KefB